ncbi:hypothetical protein LZL87_011381 [Fusarium oxysporum]|nr:hypothetical protein LZL87_011381 [Fusarium oxysporum]
MRILTHTLPQFDTRSLDVLTGKTMKLDDDAAWEDDGKTIQEDSEPESELLDEGFDGFLDDQNCSNGQVSDQRLVLAWLAMHPCWQCHLSAVQFTN